MQQRAALHGLACSSCTTYDQLMAWTRQLPSGKFQGIFRDSDGRAKTAGTWDHDSAALKAAVAAEKADRKPEPVIRTSSKATVADIAPGWTAGRLGKKAPSTLRDDEGFLKNWILPKWGPVQVRTITRADVQAWADEIGRGGLTPASVKKRVHSLSTVLDHAMDLQIIDTNPCTRIRVGLMPQQQDRWLADDEVEAVRSALPAGEHRLVFDLLIGTGMRWSEMTAVHVDDLDAKGFALQVNRSYDAPGRVFKPLKNYAVRTVPLTAALAEALEAQGRRSASSRPGRCKYENLSVLPRMGLLIPNSLGEPLTNSYFRTHLQAAGSVAKVERSGQKVAVGKVRIHDLRHTYASRLVQRGIPLDQVQKLLGHSSVIVTQRYARHGNEFFDNVRDALG